MALEDYLNSSKMDVFVEKLKKVAASAKDMAVSATNAVSKQVSGMFNSGEYSKQIEYLIDQFVEDGVLSDDEHTVLLKKVHEAGIDEQEFETILAGRLKRVQDRIQAEVEEAKKSTLLKKLMDKIDVVNTNVNLTSSQKEEQVNSLILNTIVPIDIDKQELLEFIQHMKAKVPAFEGSILRGSSSPYFIKYKEAMEHIKTSFTDDALFNELILEEKSIRENDKRKIQDIELEIKQLEEITAGILGKLKIDENAKLKQLRTRLEQHNKWLNREGADGRRDECDSNDTNW